MSSTTYASTTSESRAVNWRQFALVGLGTVVAAVVANTLFYYIGGALVTYDPDFVILTNPGGTILFTLVPAIVAVLLYAALLRFAKDPARVFKMIAAVVLIVSVIPDFTYLPSVEGSTGGQIAILVLMHVIAAGVIVGMLTTLTRQHSR